MTVSTYGRNHEDQDGRGKGHAIHNYHIIFGTMKTHI